MVATGLASLALLASGCGGRSKSPSVASLATTASSGTLTSSSSGSPAAPVSSSPVSPGGSHGDVSFQMVGVTGTDEVKFAACMRSNKVLSFPDPNAQGVFSLSGLDSNSPGFQTAMQTCQKLMPHNGALSLAQQAQQTTQMRNYSACMHSHGLRNFPEPNPQGDLTFGASGGNNPNSSQFQAAQKACTSLAPGGGPP